MVKPKSKVIPKYKVGDEVMVRALISAVVNTESNKPLYAIEIDRNYEAELFEDAIEGKAELIEPTKVGTVVIVANAPWTLEYTDDNGENWVGPYGETRTWQQLLIEGTPKVVWEPEEPTKKEIRNNLECDKDCYECARIVSLNSRTGTVAGIRPCAHCPACLSDEPIQPWND